MQVQASLFFDGRCEGPWRRLSNGLFRNERVCNSDGRSLILPKLESRLSVVQGCLETIKL
jgi:hypothetical protein